MRAKKAQGLPFKQIIVAAIVLLTLVIVAMIGPGAIQTGFKNLLKVIGLAEDEYATGGDYILNPSVKVIDESTVMLQYTPNPIRCAQIKEDFPYVITQGFAPYPEEYIPDAKFEEFKTIGGKVTNCGKRRTVDNIMLIHPEEFGTRIIRIEVHGATGVLETVPVEVNKWELLLFTYLNAPMSRMGDTMEGETALEWAIIMHTDPGVLVSHPGDQSMNLNKPKMVKVEDLLGLSGNTIEDLDGKYEGNFQDFLVNLGCAYPGDHTDILFDPQVKRRTFQVIVTALFSDIQDFSGQSGQSNHPEQPVPRLRNGVGIRGYTSKVDKDYRNQLLPIHLEVNYPQTEWSGAEFYLPGLVRGHNNLFTVWSKELGASFTFDSPEDSCFKGNQIEVQLRFCPESTCKIGEEEGEAPEPEKQDPGEMEDGDCFVSVMDPCGGSIFYVEDETWICLYDAVLGVNQAHLCDDGAIVEVRSCDCVNHPCEMSSPLDESEWGCV